MAKTPARVRNWFDRVEDFLDELPAAGPAYRKLQGTLRFLILVWRGSVANRCPVRAAALSYTTLLALVPLLAVVLSVSKTFLRDTSASVVPDLMNKTIAFIAPDLGTASPDAQRETVEKIQSFIDNINAGTLGAVGTVFLIFVAVRLLMAVEQTLNDIWGVPVGRSIWRKIVYYWTTVTLGPLLLVLAVYLTGRAEVMSVMGRLSVVPGFQKLLLELAPFVVLWVAFSLMYALMPNTHVRPTAAIAGGVFAGTLWQVNNWLSTLYVSRVITYTKIYGALGIIPVLLVGLYFSWLIVLLGAQVAYATQHIRIYLQQRASERIDQRGRELVACRVVFIACQHFLRGTEPPTVDELVEQIGAPANWLTQLVYRLAEGGVLAQVGVAGSGVVPARSPDTITVADVLEILRTGPVAHRGDSRAGDETMKAVLATLDSELRDSPSNHRFSELVGRLK